MYLAKLHYLSAQLAQFFKLSTRQAIIVFAIICKGAFDPLVDRGGAGLIHPYQTFNAATSSR